jgi:glycine/D-amino acid oxidase-like deaminating enzyme
LLATIAIARGARANGAKIFTHETVKSIVADDANRFLVQTTQRMHRSACILNAAGVWAKEIFNMVNVNIPIRLSPMQALITEKIPPLFPHIITHVEGKLTLKQMENGSVLIGGGWEGTGDVERGISTVRLESLTGNIDYAGRVVPALKSLDIIRTWAGLEGRSPDLYPLLGSLQHLPGFYAACCARGGFTMGPVLGKLVSELIVKGESSFPIDDLDVNRAVRH